MKLNDNHIVGRTVRTAGNDRTVQQVFSFKFMTVSSAGGGERGDR